MSFPRQLLRVANHSVKTSGVSIRGVVTAAADIDARTQVRTLDDLPGPEPWPIVGNFPAYVKKENIGKLHIYMDRLHKKYGPMFKDKLGPVTQVHICDPDMVAEVYRKQGKHPLRPPIQAWREWRVHNDHVEGIVTGEGENWFRMRRALNTRMMKPNMVMEFEDSLNTVLDDFMVRLRNVRNSEGDESLAGSLPQELYKWAFESIGTILFETRLGCFEDDLPKRAKDFIGATNTMNSSSLQVIIGEKLHRKWNTPFWKKHAASWETLFSITKELVDSRLKEMTNSWEAGEDPVSGRGDFLTHLLMNQDLSSEEIYANLTEIMLGGVDTTSNTLCFLLHLLAQNPQAQERLSEEVAMVTKGGTPTKALVKEMPYLKGVVKETQRLYPVITMNVRLADDDVTIAGHRFPKGTLFILHHYTSARDEKYFERPLEFLPERWGRDGKNNHHPFAVLPFGFGVRGCIGRRIAELELLLATARISQNFHVLPLEGAELKPFLRILLTPGDVVPVKLLDKN